MNGKHQFALILLNLVTLFTVQSCSKNPRAVFEGSSTLEATEIIVSVKTGGTVVEKAVEEGSLAESGQVLVRIETEKAELQRRQLVAGLAELRLNLQNAERAAVLAKETFDAMEKKYTRIRSLRDENSVSQQQYEDVETAYRAAKTQYENTATSLQALKAKEEQIRLQIELADSQLRDAVITAPIRGTVLQTYVERGEIARPGGAVVSLADLSRMWIKIYIQEGVLGKIHLGDEATLKISSAPTNTFKGKVTWISAKAEFTPKIVQTKDARSDLVYAVKIEVPNPDGILKIGMPADVVIPGNFKK
jgi:HlyD family secretion protein